MTKTFDNSPKESQPSAVQKPRAAWGERENAALVAAIKVKERELQESARAREQSPLNNREVEKKSFSVLQAIQEVSASLAKKFSSLKTRFQTFKFDFGKSNRVAPIDVEPETKTAEKEASAKTESAPAKTSNVIRVAPYEKGLPHYSEEGSPASKVEAKTPPEYTPSFTVESKAGANPKSSTPLNNDSVTRPNSPPPSYESLTSIILDHGILSQESSTDEETAILPTIEAKTSSAPTSQGMKVTSNAQAQTEPKKDELDKLFQEYRNFFRSEGEKLEGTLLNISERLEQNFLLKDAVLHGDGSKALNQNTSVRLKDFLENSELKIGERKAIASSLQINLLDGKVEKESDLAKSSLPKAETAAEIPKSQHGGITKNMHGLELIKSIVADQKKAAAKDQAGQSDQGVNVKKTVSFGEEKSTTITAIDEMLREKYGKAPSTEPKTNKSAAKPLNGHTGQLQL